MSEFPSMKAKRMLRILMSEPLNYRIKAQRGSHRILVSESYPQLLFAEHHAAEMSPLRVRAMLMGGVKLSEVEALELLK